MSDKRYKTEWTFSFENLGETLGRNFGKMGDKFRGMVDSVSDVEVKEAHYDAPMDGVQSARVELDFSIGQATIQKSTDPDKLIDADVRYVGDLEFEVSGEDERYVWLGQRTGPSVAFKGGVSFVGKKDDLRWDVKLNPSVPLKLDVESGVGKSEIDLRGMMLERLELECGVGKTELTLPDSEKGYTVTVDSGVGQTIVNLAARAAARMDIQCGIGGVRLNVPRDAAVRLTVDGNLGSVRVPDYFKRVQANIDRLSRGGVWETPGFAVAANQTYVDFEGGIGSLSVVLDESDSVKHV
jgi:hypothetical protein